MNWKTYLKKKGARGGAIVVAVVLVLALIAIFMIATGRIRPF